MAKGKEIATDISTEEKIKDAARKVFLQKGYAATRTRDIAEASGINLSLLNYYFRSKEKLFQIVMQEKLQALFGSIAPVISDAHTSLEQKIELFAQRYTDVLNENPDLPLFVLSEMRNDPERLMVKAGFAKLLTQSMMVKQIQERRPDLNPLHFFTSLLGMTVFPFIAKPVLGAAGAVSEQAFKTLTEERKELIPKWMKAMLKAK